MPSATSNFPVVCYGEVLWDFLPAGKMAGGAPVNVAYHLKKLGINPAVLTAIGNDDDGKEIKSFFESKNIDSTFFQSNENQTGKVIADTKEYEVVYDIIKPVAWDFIQWNEEWMPLIQASQFFIFGSLAARMAVSRKTLFQCLEIANTKVLDINLRPPHFSVNLLKELFLKADILKLNQSELQLISNEFHDLKKEEDQIRWLKDHFRIETIVVTKAGDGAVLYHHDQFFRHTGYPVVVADTIGSGDAFLAALIASFAEKTSPAEALDFANALGALVASRAGGCPSYAVSEIPAWKKK